MGRNPTTKRFVGTNHDIQQACELINTRFNSTNPANPVLAKITKNKENNTEELLVFYGNLQVTESVINRFDGLVQFCNLRAVI